jgi:hypothetical protein
MIKRNRPEYLMVVKDYAETLIQKGRDRYGPQHSPLFATTLNPYTFRIFEGKQREEILNLKRENWGIRNHDRMVTGANPMHDLNLYQILYALSEISENPNYAFEAEKTLKWFFENCQSSITGLMAWGEHIGWDFETETIIEKKAGFNHEFFRPWVLWEQVYSLAPDAALKFAKGVWDHPIANQEHIDFSRHARYDRHEPGRYSEYPRHGGFYIQTWVYAYRYSKDPTFLIAIEKLVDFFESHRQKSTNMIAAERAERSKGTQVMKQLLNLTLG